ncbi:MAG: hypothetical protein Q8P67_19760 [archaeon]|nr:hypothetical protein [archaeon]
MVSRSDEDENRPLSSWLMKKMRIFVRGFFYGFNDDWLLVWVNDWIGSENGLCAGKRFAGFFFTQAKNGLF